MCFLQKRDGETDRHGKGPFAEPRAKGGWFEDVGKRQSSWLGESVARFSAASGKALRICFRSPAFVLPPIVGVNRFIY